MINVDLRTIGWRAANSDLSSVADVVVLDVERNAASTKLTSRFHSLGTSAVVLNHLLGSMLIDPGNKIESCLASGTTDRTCVYDSQGDEDQRQKSVHGKQDGTEIALKFRSPCMFL